MDTPRRKPRPRLEPTAYYDPNRLYFITLCDHPTLAARLPPPISPTAPFLHPPLATAITQALHLRHHRGDWRLCCYCLMPDHLHLIASPRTKPITTLVAGFESYTMRAAWDLGIGGKLWQRSFHDRVVRDREINATIAYVLNNPIKAGLVATWGAWPWSFVAQ